MENSDKNNPEFDTISLNETSNGRLNSWKRKSNWGNPKQNETKQTQIESTKQEKENKCLMLVLHQFPDELPKLSVDVNILYVILISYTHQLSYLIEAGYPYNIDFSKKSKCNILAPADAEYYTMYEVRCELCYRWYNMYNHSILNDSERCIYHEKELNKPFYRNSKKTWTCCNNEVGNLGCLKASNHNWNKFFYIPENEYKGFIKTKPSTEKKDFYGIYGLDCGMVQVEGGFMLSEVALVDVTGKTIYFSFVNIKRRILDRMVKHKYDQIRSSQKTFKTVQNELLQFISSETILIGHGLENDLKALCIIHYNVIDTSLLLNRENAFPYRYRLQELVQYFLQRDIQLSAHSAVEDALAAIQLTLYKIYHDGFDSTIINSSPNVIKKMIENKQHARRKKKNGGAGAAAARASNNLDNTTDNNSEQKTDKRIKQTNKPIIKQRNLPPLRNNILKKRKSQPKFKKY